MLQSPTVGHVAFTVVRLVALECTRGIINTYTTADIVLEIGSTSGSVEQEIEICRRAHL